MRSFITHLRLRAIEAMAKDGPPEPLLHELCTSLQSEIPEALVGITVLDAQGEGFAFGVFPSLPVAFSQFLRGRKFNSEARGSCGLAVMEARVIEVEDIATDMRFGKAWRDWMVASGIASVVSTPMVSPDGTVQGTIATCFPGRLSLTSKARVSIGLIAELGAQVAIYTRTKLHAKLRMDEAEHQMRNLFARVDAVANSTLRTNPDPQDFRIALGKRLRAMAQAHALAQRSGGEMLLGELVEAVLLPYMESHTIRQSGPMLQLSPAAASALALALNELTTNAVKHGALSTAGGAIDVTWSIPEHAGPAHFHLTWQETGGPVVSTPQSAGQGMRTISESIQHGFGGFATHHYLPQGICCSISAPFTNRLGRSNPATEY